MLKEISPAVAGSNPTLDTTSKTLNDEIDLDCARARGPNSLKIFAQFKNVSGVFQGPQIRKTISTLFNPFKRWSMTNLARLKSIYKL
jgi:hypothetical protein